MSAHSIRDLSNESDDVSIVDKLRDEGEELFHAFAEDGLVYIMWHEEDKDVQAVGGLKSQQARAIADDLPDEAESLAEEIRTIADVADTQIVRRVGSVKEA